MDENPADALPYLVRAAHRPYGLITAKRFQPIWAKIQSRNRNAEYRHVVAEFFLSVNLPKRTEGEMNRLLTISPNNIEAKLMLDNLANRQ